VGADRKGLVVHWSFSILAERTLQGDRRRKDERFPSYRAGRPVLYDLNEIEQIIQRSRRASGAAAEAE
jgi:hypothetical protein